MASLLTRANRTAPQRWHQPQIRRRTRNVNRRGAGYRACAPSEWQSGPSDDDRMFLERAREIGDSIAALAEPTARSSRWQTSNYAGNPVYISDAFNGVAGTTILPADLFAATGGRYVLYLASDPLYETTHGIWTKRCLNSISRSEVEPVAEWDGDASASSSLRARFLGWSRGRFRPIASPGRSPTADR